MNKVIFIFVLSCVAFHLHGAASDFGGIGYYEDDEFSEPENSEKVLTVPDSNSLVGSKPLDYRIGHRDLLDVRVFRADDLNRAVRVNEGGEISLPLIGKVKVGGLSVTEAEELLAVKLSEKYMQDPHVSVFIKEYESQKITINGYVKSPGIFPLKGRLTLIQAISQANGMDRLADATDVVIFRRKGDEGTVGYRVNFEEVQTGKVADPVVRSDDIVVVPQNGSRAAFEDTTRTLRTFLGFVPFF